MRTALVVAVIAAFPPTLAAVLGYLANSRSLRKAVGNAPGVPIARSLERLEEKVDRLGEGQAIVRERLAKLEGIASVETKTKERSA